MRRRQVNLTLPDKLRPVFVGIADYRGAFGGRGGAKTIAFANMALMDILKPAQKPWKFLCGRELQKSLKDSVFSVLSSQVSELGLSDAFDIGKEYLRCKNGNEFLFYGLRTNIAEVKGLHGVRRTWLEEAQRVSQSSLTYLLPTVFRDFEDCELWATWNPDDEDDPIHQLFVQNPPPNTRCEKINWYDNPWFPNSLNKLRLHDQKFNAARYAWIWEGSFNVNPEGAVYAKWISQDRTRTGLYDPNLPVHTAWDLGLSDYTTIWFFQAIRGEIRLIDFYENNREDIRHYCEQLAGHEFIVDSVGAQGKISYRRGPDIEGLERRRGYNYGDHFLPHDGAYKLFAAGGRSVVEQAFDFGFKMHAIASQRQQAQIDVARKALDVAWFDSEFCAEGLKSLRKYEFEFDEDKQRYKEVPLHNWASHACDAFEVLSQVARSPMMEREKEKPRFLADMTADEIFWGEAAVEQRERL